MSLSTEYNKTPNQYQFFKANWMKEDEQFRIENPEKQNLWSQVPSINITNELKADNEALEELRLAYKPFAQKGLYIDEFQNMGLSVDHLEKNLFIHYYGKNDSGKNQYALVSKYENTPIFKRHDSATTLFEEIIKHKDFLLEVTLQFYNKEIIDENDFTFRIKKFKPLEMNDLVGEGFEIKNNELTEFKYSGDGFPWIGFTTEINPNSPLAYFYTKAFFVDIDNKMHVYYGVKSDVATVYLKGQEAPVIFQTVNYTKFPKIGLQLYPNTDYNFNERMAFLKIIVSNQPIEIYNDVQEINFTKNWTVFTFPIKIVQEKIGKPTNLVGHTVSSGYFKSQKNVLWVYDDPFNKDNENIIKKLIENNYTVDHVKDTETALSNLETTDYELIISDSTRAKDDEAGIKLLKEIKSRDIATRFVLYTTTYMVKKSEKQALELGAFAVKTGRWEVMCEYFLGLLDNNNQKSNPENFNSYLYNIERLIDENSDGGNILKTLYKVLINFKEDLDMFGELEKRYGESFNINDFDLRIVQNVVINSLPSPIGEQVRKLLVSDEYIEEEFPKLERLRFMINTYTVVIDLVLFVMLSQLWEEKEKRKGDSSFTINSSLKRSIKEFFQQNSLSRQGYDVVPLIQNISKLFAQYDITSFIVEVKHWMKLISNEESEFYRAYKFLNDIKYKYQDINNIVLSFKEDEIIADYTKTGVELCNILKEFGFICKYKFATIKGINIVNKKNQPPLFEHKMVKLDYVLVGFADKKEDFDNFTPSKTVIIYKIENRKIEFINLYPFIIDINALLEDDLSKVYFYSNINQSPKDATCTYRFVKNINRNKDCLQIPLNQDFFNSKRTLKLSEVDTKSVFNEVLTTLEDFISNFE